MNRVDDTINLSELHPVEVTPEPHSNYLSRGIILNIYLNIAQRQEEEYSPQLYNVPPTEVQRNLSQLSISQIAIEPNFIHNTEMSQAH